MYLYIFEDGSLSIFEQKPTKSDYQSCEDGVLRIVDLEDGSFYMQDDFWSEIEEGLTIEDHYLYIFEDDDLAVKEDAPGEEDLQSCEDGVLVIVKMKEGTVYIDGEWEEIERPEKE